MNGKLKTGDLIIFAAVILGAVILFLCFFFRGGEGNSLVVSYSDRKEVYSLEDDDSFDIDSNGYHLKVVIEDGCVYVKNADCPDNTCVHSGKISGEGQLIACVPAGVVLRIDGEEKSYDFIAG